MQANGGKTEIIQSYLGLLNHGNTQKLKIQLRQLISDFDAHIV